MPENSTVRSANVVPDLSAPLGAHARAGGTGPSSYRQAPLAPQTGEQIVLRRGHTCPVKGTNEHLAAHKFREEIYSES